MSNTELEAGDNRDLIEELTCAIYIVESPVSHAKRLQLEAEYIAGKGVEINCYTLWKR